MAYLLQLVFFLVISQYFLVISQYFLVISQYFLVISQYFLVIYLCLPSMWRGFSQSYKSLQVLLQIFTLSLQITLSLYLSNINIKNPKF